MHFVDYLDIFPQRRKSKEEQIEFDKMKEEMEKIAIDISKDFKLVNGRLIRRKL